MRKTLLLLTLLAAPAAAQMPDGTYTFNLLPDPNNMTSCIGLEPSFEMPFTLVMAGGSGTLTSSGGISLKMTPSAPDQIHGVFELSLQRFDYTVSLATKTLSVVGNNLGCKFTGPAS
ncbi:hypothetical protein [Reyranella sp.]|uniref:hypothetical protein n=1 Tax=Reyranella sp. TaxID=1929291 RepID=UPI003D128182